MKQGTNAAIMRKRNEKTILSLINSRPISRAEIAKITGLTRAAVTIIIDELISRGYILEEHTRQATVGRQPVMLSFNGESIYSIGINIQRSSFYVGISDLNGKVITEERFSILPPEAFFECIGEIVEGQIAKAGIDRAKIYGIGVASPGPIDVKKQKILRPPNFNAWHNVPVAERLKECLGWEIHLENVSNASALAEMYYGEVKNVHHFMALFVDDGIGSGIVLDHQLFDRSNELGHTSICYNGIVCECGNRGCLEKYAAIPMILAGTGYKSWNEVVAANDIGIIEREAEYLSTAIINANNLFDLDIVILCGELRYHSEALTERIFDSVNQRSLHSRPVQIRSGKVTSKSLVAASLVTHDFFTN